MTPALKKYGLRKRFSGRQVLDGFSLQVARGEVVGLLGPNGCGKSTVLNMVCQLLQADAGQVQLMGEPLTRLGAAARARVGLCAQDCALYPDLLPEQNLHFVGLGPHAATRAGRLSGGAGSSGCIWRCHWCTAPNCWCWTSPRPRSTWPHGWTCGG